MDRAEHIVRFWLKWNGVETYPGPYKNPFDLVTHRGIRIEVKRSTVHRKDGEVFWTFNIHRHCTLKENEVDYYVLRCETDAECGIGESFNLVIPAPLRTKVVRVTLRSLVTKWARHFNAVKLIKGGRKVQIFRHREGRE